jgi:hypothetical protein
VSVRHLKRRSDHSDDRSRKLCGCHGEPNRRKRRCGQCRYGDERHGRIVIAGLNSQPVLPWNRVVFVEVRMNRTGLMMLSDVIIQMGMERRQFDEHRLHGDGKSERDAPSNHTTIVVGRPR